MTSRKTIQRALSKRVETPRAFAPLFKPYRYKIYYGGRAGCKSWQFARAILLRAAQEKIRVLCAREFQNSIKDSVIALLKDQIYALGLEDLFEVSGNKIFGVNGSEFIFKGLGRSCSEIKSLEGVDICWVEEAQRVSENSWVYLVPTIRKAGSEIWISFNPDLEEDPTWQRYVMKKHENSIVVKVGYEDNPWFTPELDKERLWMLENDPDAYDWIWGGNCRKISNAVIFKGKYSIREFETPLDAHFYHGVDWGFAQDPSTAMRMFIEDNTLYIDEELYEIGVELDHMEEFWLGIPTMATWPIKADNSRPETISHMARRNFNVSGAKKWGGSVEDGINVLKGFKEIVIHPRCKHMADEARLYSFKVDRITQDVLPIIQDAHNHCWDAVRYALDGYIRGKGNMRINPRILRKTPWKRR